MSITIPAGHRLVATVTLQNQGQQTGSYSLTGILTLPGSSVAEAHLTTATGSVAPGQSVQVQLESLAGLAYGDQIAGYQTSSGLDLVLQLTNTSTGAASSLRYPSAVFLQYRSVPTQAPQVAWYTNAGNVVVVVSGAQQGQDYQLEHVDAFGFPLGMLGENSTGVFLLSGPAGYGMHIAARICSPVGCSPWSFPVEVVFPGSYAPPPLTTSSTTESSPPLQQPTTTPGRFVPPAF